MNILVTGGAGFIGSHLCTSLLDKGNSVVCVDNLISGKESNISHLKENRQFKFINADTNKSDFISKIKEMSFDQIYHYAACVGVERTIKYPTRVMADAEGFKQIMDYAANSGVKKVIFASSSEVYGEPHDIPEKEDGILNAKLPYAVVKLLGEKYLEVYNQEFGIDTLSLRFFNVFGPRQDSTKWGFVVGIFIKSALENKSLPIIGDGNQTRDFVYVMDNINASILAANTKKCNNVSLNIGYGSETKIIEMAETVNKLTGNKAGFKFEPNRQHEIYRRCADISKLTKLTGFKPKYSISDGLKETINWYKGK
jgi:UDP-glucuronate decarboxylase